MSTQNQKILDQRIQRFIQCNTKMREATLASEREFLKSAGNISAAQLQIILTIGDNTPCTMSQLAKILHFSKANITQMVNRLIQNKWVKKIRNKGDQRVVEVKLLAKGQKIITLNEEHVKRVAKSWFDTMTHEEQEIMLSMWERYLQTQ